MKNEFILSNKVTRCEFCGDEIANLVGLPPEKVCAECADRLNKAAADKSEMDEYRNMAKDEIYEEN